MESTTKVDERKTRHVYLIRCKDTDKCNGEYIGSTCNLYDRSRLHKSDCIISKSILYRTIRENGGWENWEMVILRTYLNITSARICIKEQQYMDILDTKLND